MKQQTAEPPENPSSTKLAPAADAIHFRGRIAELDGLRAVGVASVLLGHFWVQSFSKIIYEIGQFGWIAVDCFFVLSGFLITGILLDSRDKPNYYKNFWSRRTLRIFPLYYATLLACYCILRFTNSGIDYRNVLQHWGSPMWFTFYVGNIRTAITGTWPPFPGYGPLWTLQVEEQFYLFFPLVVALVPRRILRNLLLACVFLSPALRILLYFLYPTNTTVEYVLLPCHCEGLALGGLIAIRFRSGPWKISRPLLAVWTLGSLSAAAAVSVIASWNSTQWAPYYPIVRIGGPSLSSPGCAGLVLWLITMRGSVQTAWLRIAPLQYLGKISYGVYMLHPLAFWVGSEMVKKRIWHFNQFSIPGILFEIALSLVLAALSWHLLEQPFVKLKDRFSYHRNKQLVTKAS
jgi:peptidoglycan/LPS O-acetylase OafA/YrhL